MWDLDFQGKMAFGALGPVSVSAARRRLKAGVAKAPQGRRGQVSFSTFRVKVLHLMKTSPPNSHRRPPPASLAFLAPRLRRAATARATSSALSAPFLTCPPPNLWRTAFCCFRPQALAADLGFYVHDKACWASSGQALRRRSNLLPLHPYG